MVTLEELNSECFQWENYESCFGDALDLSYVLFSRIPESKDNELHAALRKYAVGWCDAQRLQFRPRYGYVAIMCEKDGYRFWFHVMQKTFDVLFDTECRDGDQ